MLQRDRRVLCQAPATLIAADASPYSISASIRRLHEEETSETVTPVTVPRRHSGDSFKGLRRAHSRNQTPYPARTIQAKAGQSPFLVAASRSHWKTEGARE